MLALRSQVQLRMSVVQAFLSVCRAQGFPATGEGVALASRQPAFLSYTQPAVCPQVFLSRVSQVGAAPPPDPETQEVPFHMQEVSFKHFRLEVSRVHGSPAPVEQVEEAESHAQLLCFRHFLSLVYFAQGSETPATHTPFVHEQLLSLSHFLLLVCTEQSMATQKLCFFLPAGSWQVPEAHWPFFSLTYMHPEVLPQVFLEASCARQGSMLGAGVGAGTGATGAGVGDGTGAGVVTATGNGVGFGVGWLAVVGDCVGGSMGVNAVVGAMVTVGRELHSHLAFLPWPSKNRICLGTMPPENRQTRAPLFTPVLLRVSHWAW